MYLSAQRVLSAARINGVNVYKYLHDESWPSTPPLDVPEHRPGRLVFSDCAIRPSLNRVLSYLDVTCSDSLAPDHIRAHLALLKLALEKTGDPTEATVGPLKVRYFHGQLRVPWKVELGALAGHLLLRVPL